LECILRQVDPLFEPASGLQYRLSILLRPDGYFFLVCDPGTNKILLLSDYSNEKNALATGNHTGWPSNCSAYFSEFESIDLLKLSCFKTDVALSSNKITVAPAEFLQGEHAELIIYAAQQKFNDEGIIREAIFEEGPTIVALFPQGIIEQCKAIFPDITLQSAMAVYAKGLLTGNVQSVERKVFVQIWRSYFEVVVCQGTRLLYLNAFNYSAPTDVLYYLIFILEQLGFVPSEEEITLMGEVDKGHIIYEQLKMYCGKLIVSQIPKAYKVGPEFSGIAWHKYFTLLNLALCE